MAITAKDQEVQRIGIFSGLYNTEDGVFLGIDGETYPRIGLTPQGQLLMGNGITPLAPAVLGGLTTEEIQDLVAAMAAAGTNITVTYNDPAGTLTFDVSGLNEPIDDRVAALIVAGNGIQKSYDDPGGALTLSITAPVQAAVDHVAATPGAHAATAVSASPSGLILITGFTTVQGAIAAADAALLTRTLNPRGVYNGGTSYILNDLVKFGGGQWRALRAVSGVSPVEGADWTEFVSPGVDAASIIVGPAQVSGNFDHSTTTYTDVPAAIVAPNTISPIQIVVSGMIGLVGSGSTSACNPEGRWQVIDDLGAVLEVYQWFGIFTAASQLLTQSLHWVVDVTPASTSRTYKLQTRIGAACTGISTRSYGTAGGSRLSVYAVTP